MKSAGSTLLFFGIGSMVLYVIGYEFAILAWIENWGEAVGWGIRGAVAALGAILFFLGMRAEGEAAEPQTE